MHVKEPGEPAPSRPGPDTRLLPTRLNVAPDAFVAPNAVLRGDVTIGSRSSVWYGAVLRGDLAPVVLGSDTNVQDGSILHVEIDGPVVLGDRVTVGHRAVVHACDVEDDCLIGIGALVLSGARIGRHSIVGAGAVVKEGWHVPPRSVVLGVPGRVVRQVSDDDLRRMDRNWRVYVAYAAQTRDREAGQGSGA
ncbi:MAG: gamma carbonic anhydrase family protein [Candidatus Polarisedimenticolia bacterium]